MCQSVIFGSLTLRNTRALNFEVKSNFSKLGVYIGFSMPLHQEIVSIGVKIAYIYKTNNKCGMNH